MTPWTTAHMALLSMEFFRQEYWSGLPFPSPGDLPDPGMEPGSPALQADSLPSEPPGKPSTVRAIIKKKKERKKNKGNSGTVAATMPAARKPCTFCKICFYLVLKMQLLCGRMIAIRKSYL